MWNREDPFERAFSADGRRETKRSNQAFRHYAMLGASRSIEKLFDAFPQLFPSDSGVIAPTKSIHTLRDWSGDFHWVERANRFDEIQNEKDRATYEARRKEIMESGLALTHERVEELKGIYTRLKGYLADQKNIWLPDVKSVRVGSALESTPEGKMREVGEYERVEFVRFNSPLFEKMFEALEALAAETGGRAKRNELTGKDGGAIQFTDISSDDLAKARQAALEYEKALLDDGR
jgi:hypothetical protein